MTCEVGCGGAEQGPRGGTGQPGEAGGGCREHRGPEEDKPADPGRAVGRGCPGAAWRGSLPPAQEGRAVGPEEGSQTLQGWGGLPVARQVGQMGPKVSHLRGALQEDQPHDVFVRLFIHSLPLLLFIQLTARHQERILNKTKMVLPSRNLQSRGSKIAHR